MKKVLIAMAVMMVASVVMAQEAKKVDAKTTDLQGKVAVTKTEAGVLQSVKLMVGDKTYTVNLDEQGKKLAEVTADKVVKVTGVVDEKALTVTVSKFSVVEEKKVEEKK